MAKICNHTQGVCWENNPNPIHHMEARMGVLPANIKRIRVVCPKCGRRMMSSIKVCADGCCILHYIPTGHKVKAWWKKKNKKSNKRKKGKRDR